MKRKMVGIILASVMALGMMGCGKDNATEVTVETLQEATDSAEVTDNAEAADNEEVTDSAEAVDNTEAADTQSEGNDGEQDEFDRIAKAIIECSENPGKDFSENGITVESNEVEAGNTTATIKLNIQDKELAYGIFSHILVITMNSVDPSLCVGCMDEPENVENTEIHLLNVSDQTYVRTVGSIHDQPDGSYLIIYFGHE